MSAIKLSDLPKAVRDRLTAETRQGRNLSQAAAELERQKRASDRERLEQTFALQLSGANFVYRRQYQAVPDRKYRWDFWLGGTPYLVEIQGAIWTQGAHNRGGGMNRDCEKAALAVIAGYVPLTFTGDQVQSGQAIEWTTQAIRAFPVNRQRYIRGAS